MIITYLISTNFFSNMFIRSKIFLNIENKKILFFFCEFFETLIKFSKCCESISKKFELFKFEIDFFELFENN